MRQHFRTLFVNDSADSLAAMAYLEGLNISFSKAIVGPVSEDPSPSDVPLLITDEGEWRGLQDVLRYSST